MKRFKLTILLLLFTGISLWAQERAPQISLDKTVHDFGLIKEEDGIVSCTFELMNTGSAPLIISRVASSCGCAVADWPKEPILPDGVASVKVTYDPNKRPGPISQRITVFSNAANSRTILTLRGNVTPRPKTLDEIYRRKIGDLGIENAHISMGKVHEKQVKVDTVSVYNFGNDPITLSFSSVPKHLNLKAIPETLEPENEGMILVTFDANNNDNWGFLINRIRVQINGENPMGNLINVSANIEEDFSHLTEEELANAPQIEFSEVSKDFGNVTEGKVIEHEFVFTNTGKSDLIIRRIRSSCGCTTVAPKESVIKPGASSSLSASFRTSGFTGRQSKSITVITNDPKKPTIVLRLSGTVAKR